MCNANVGMPPAGDYEKEQLAGGVQVYVSAAHRFGTDAMLLSYFSLPHRQHTACDLGTGCGIIPLRWHALGHTGYAVGVELAAEGAALLNAAVQAQNISHIKAHGGDLRTVTKKVLQVPGGFHTVSCNPPYFTGGAISQKPGYGAARHEVTCTTKDICAAAARLLRFGGRFAVCHKPERLADLFWAMKEYKIEPKELKFVFQHPGASTPWLCLVAGRLGAAGGLRMLPPLYIKDENGAYSAEYKKIYNQS